MRNYIDYFKKLLVPSSKNEWSLSLVTIQVRNLSVMKKFYTQVLGLSVLQEFEKEVLIGHNRGSVPLIRFIQGRGDSNSTLTTYSIGFDLKNEVNFGEFLNRLILEEQTILGTGYDGYSHNYYIVDPENNRLKFSYYDDSKMDEHDLYMEGSSIKRSLHDIITGIEEVAEEFPPAACVFQVHYTVKDVEETTNFLLEAFPFSTTFDYITKRKNFKVNQDGYSIAINSWEFIPKDQQQFYGLSEIGFKVPTMKSLEKLVTHLEQHHIPFKYLDAELFVPTDDGVQYAFKVGDYL